MSVFQIAMLPASQIRVGMKMLSPLGSKGFLGLTVREVIGVGKCRIQTRELFPFGSAKHDPNEMLDAIEVTCADTKNGFFLPNWMVCIAAEEEHEEV